MKKTNIFKALTAITAVLFTSIFITGCIPTTPGGNPTPSNQFDIYISDVGINISDPNPNMWYKSKTIIIDGDSIKFELRVGSQWAPTETFAIRSKTSSGVFQFLTTNQSLGGSNTVDILADFPLNISIPSSLSNNYNWTNSKLYSDNNIGGYIDPNAFISGYEFFGASVASMFPLFNIAKNEDRFFVFRKAKGSDFQYYWVKVKYTPNIAGQNAGGYAFNVLTGKYQLNSIITGQ